MIYAVTYKLSDLIGPAGYVSENKDEVLAHAVEIAAIALDQMDDAVALSDWYDLKGGNADPRNLLSAASEGERRNTIQQISDHLKSENSGFIDLWEYADVFSLIEEHDVETWCSDRLRKVIFECRKNVSSLLQLIAEEWSGS
jgi:hypothetical protein